MSRFAFFFSLALAKSELMGVLKAISTFCEVLSILSFILKSLIYN